MPVYCEVALPVPLDRIFTYLVPEGQRVRRGARVIAPFRNEKLIGVVTGLTEVPPVDFEARALEAVLDEEPLLGERLLELAEWIAQYYLAPLGEVLRGMLPLMAEVKRTVYYRITDLGRDVLAKFIETGADSASGAKAPHFLGSSTARLKPPQLQRPVAGDPRKSCPDSEHDRELLRPEQEHDSVSVEQRVLERLAEGEPVKVSTLRTASGASLPAIAQLVKRKWITRETTAFERDARRMERFAVLIPETRLPKLTEMQQGILAELAACGGELPLAALRAKNLPHSTL